jgi:LPXTG-motif cell wall-anchored protein
MADVPSTSPIDGSVQGVVWFDRNGNGALDGNEWVLPGVTVTIEAGTSKSQSLRLEAAPLNQTAVTGADGSYFFGGLAVGAYRVTAHVSLNGFDYTSDTDGLADWIVAVDIVAQATAHADFAGLGHGEIIGQVFDATTLQGVAGATIRCSWSGFDDILGNDDDVLFTDVADDTGSFDMAGVPYGYFSCVGLDPLTSRQSSAAAATVFSIEAVHAPLPLAAGAAPNRLSVTATLPSTGHDTLGSLWLALFLVSAGIGTTALTRRRKT